MSAAERPHEEGPPSAPPRGQFGKGNRLKLRLYVAGSAPNSLAAMANLSAVRAELAEHELEVVDVLARPERALADAVLVTPTLMKLAPRPTCRIVGDLRDTRRVLASLGALGELS